MKKDIVVNEYEQPDVVKDQEHFLKKMEELKLYLVELEEDNIMKAKNYSSDCKIGDNQYQQIILIIYDESTFLSNDIICKAETRICNTFL